MNQQEKFYSYDESFTEYVSYIEYDIVEIAEKGILLKDGNFIDFDLCAENFKSEHNKSNGNCVAERMSPVFIFYTKPNPTKLIFIHKNKILELFSPTYKRVYDFQKKLNYYGFTTYDMT